jgi:hypothetical protein
MGYIKEPKGIDLIFPPAKLSKKEAAETAEFIRNYKLKTKKRVSKKIVLDANK